MYKQFIFMFIVILFCTSCGVTYYVNASRYSRSENQKELKNINIDKFLSKLGFENSNSCSEARYCGDSYNDRELPKAIRNYFVANNGQCFSNYSDYREGLASKQYIYCFMNNDLKLIVETKENNNCKYYCVTTDKKIYESEIAYKEAKLKQAEMEAERKRVEEEKKKKEEEKKKKEEERRISILRNRKGQFVMDFYLVGTVTSNSVWATRPNSCWSACSKANYNMTGYWTIDEALQNGWTVKQILGDIAQSGVTYDDCTCQGKKYLMIKQ